MGNGENGAKNIAKINQILGSSKVIIGLCILFVSIGINYGVTQSNISTLSEKIDDISSDLKGISESEHDLSEKIILLEAHQEDIIKTLERLMQRSK